MFTPATSANVQKLEKKVPAAKLSPPGLDCQKDFFTLAYQYLGSGW